LTVELEHVEDHEEEGAAKRPPPSGRTVPHVAVQVLGRARGLLKGGGAPPRRPAKTSRPRRLSAPPLCFSTSWGRFPTGCRPASHAGGRAPVLCGGPRMASRRACRISSLDHQPLGRRALAGRQSTRLHIYAARKGGKCSSRRGGLRLRISGPRRRSSFPS